ncbi:MAG: hypothetical protein K0R66_1766 [Gammaproteobacteria bacterium]|jgi:hypothetical protein|nr:hypothetical protein [Gammaproteobacteria bacterium]
MPKTKRSQLADETISEGSSDESRSPSAKRQRIEPKAAEVSASYHATQGSQNSSASSTASHKPEASASSAAPTIQAPRPVRALPNEIIGLYVVGTWLQLLPKSPSYHQLPHLVAYYQHLLPKEFHQVVVKGLQAIMSPVAAPVAMPPVFSPASFPGYTIYSAVPMPGFNPYLGPPSLPRTTQPMLSQNAPSLPASFPAMSPAAVQQFLTNVAPVMQTMQSPRQVRSAQAEPARGTRV